MRKKRIQAITGLILVGTAIFCTIHWHSEKPLAELIEQYQFDNSQFINIDGIDVHYRISGEGEPLVLVHGFGGNMYNFKDWTTHLEKHYRVINFDLPGFGLSGIPDPTKISNAHYIDYMESLLDTLGIDTCYMAGNSFGGGLAFEYALDNPGKVKKLALMGPSGYPQTENNLIGFKLAETPIMKHVIKRITPRFVVRQTLETIYLDDAFVTPENIQFYLDMTTRAGAREHIVHKMNHSRTFRHKEIPKLTMPVLVLWGTGDVVIPVEKAPLFKRDLPDVELIIYDNLGHLPMEEAPEMTVNEVIRFLE